jgi:hypothetical protein
MNLTLKECDKAITPTSPHKWPKGYELMRITIMINFLTNSVALLHKWITLSNHCLLAKLVPTSAHRGVSHSQRGRSPMAVIWSFLNWSLYFFIQVAPHLSSRGWMDPVPDPLLLRKPGSAGNRTRTSGSVARNSDHQTTEAVLKAPCIRNLFQQDRLSVEASIVMFWGSWWKTSSANILAPW